MACPLARGWCTDHETDSDGTEFCRSADVEIASGWMLTLLDSGDGPGVELSDPRGLLQIELVDPLTLDAAYDLMIALATVLRDAHKPTAAAPIGA